MKRRGEKGSYSIKKPEKHGSKQRTSPFSVAFQAFGLPLALLLRAAVAAILRGGLAQGVEADEVYEEAPHAGRQSASTAAEP